LSGIERLKVLVEILLLRFLSLIFDRDGSFGLVRGRIAWQTLGGGGCCFVRINASISLFIVGETIKPRSRTTIFDLVVLLEQAP